MIDSAFLMEGKLYIRAPKQSGRVGFSVNGDGFTAPLSPLGSDGKRPPGTAFRFPLSVPDGPLSLVEHFPEGTDAAPTSDASVNGLMDWAIENGQTVQLRIDHRDTPRALSIGHAIDIPASDQAYTFKALIAAHRCDATLCVTFSPASQAEPVMVEVPFQTRFRGGRHATGYQHVTIPCPFQGADVRVTMQIAYIRYRPDGDDNHPYVFIANPEVSTKLAERRLVQPRSLARGASGAGEWFVAEVPLFTQETAAALTLRTGRDAMDLFAPEPNEVTLVADDRHSIILKARTPQTFLFYVDGTAIETVHIGTEATPIRLPQECLRGEVVGVTLRDLSGSQVYLSLPLLAPRILTPQDVMARESRAPFPTDLTARANHRYRALRAHLKHPVEGLDPVSLTTAIEALDCTYETVRLTPITFPKVDRPQVSVIVPVHNKINVTYYGLCALLVAHNCASFEVIVVDDASTDETTGIEDIVSGITVIHNTEAQRFIRACNAGAAAARGDYIVLLNNDTEATTGWLDALIDAFGRFDNVGLAGSKLLYPDGKLQDAGGIIWDSGNPWNYGNRQNPWEPRFSYARQADYLSGAAMMTTRKIWDELGGLSAYLEPMYFEDTDFAFKVRNAGYKTYFVPSSVVYHFEGMTSGTDVSTGFKRFQEVNRPKFKRRWAREFTAFGKEGQSPDLEKDRGIVGRVLFIDYTTPREDRDAGSYAARREIELVQSLGYKVTFLPQNLAHFGVYTEELEKSGVEVITAPFYLSVPEFLEHRAAEFDAVYITRYYVAQDTIPHIRKHAPKAKILFNNADLHFLRELRAALSTNDASRLAAVQSIREQELAMMKAADLVLSYNEVEHSVITSHTDGQARVLTCPWVVDIPETVPPLDARRGLSFLGSFKHHPNAEGVKWFCSTVMPLLDGAGAHLTIYGAGMDDAIKALASDNIDPVGFVENIAEAYDRHRIFVAPLLSGAGIKGKVLSAIAHGIPTVLTPVAAEGIGLRHGHDCLIAERPEDWAEAITRLLTEDKLWTSISEAARTYAAERFSFAEGRARMREAFEAVDLFGAV